MSRWDRKFTFHYIGNVHLPVSLVYNACAFTQKIHKLCEMLVKQGHTVILYGAETSDAPCTELVVTHSVEKIKAAFGDSPCTTDDPLGYEWRTSDGGFRHDFDSKLPISHEFNRTCIQEIEKRKKPDHFLLLSMGYYQKPIADGVKMHLTCEPGIGYRGSFADFRAFESSYIQNFMYGSEHPYESLNGKNYDRVIPNYYRVQDFVPPCACQGSGGNDCSLCHLCQHPCHEGTACAPKSYYLFMGRLIHRKGLIIAYQACKLLGAPLKIAGQGYKSWNPETRTLVDQDGNTFELADNMEFVGYADAETRRTLMLDAIAVFCPSLYLEPFCGVNAEAQLCGTPVITTDFGAFTDTVEQGVTGVRCLTLCDYVDAMEQVKGMNRDHIHRRALGRFSCEAVMVQFEKWFQDLYNVFESSTIPGVKGWSRTGGTSAPPRTPLK